MTRIVELSLSGLSSVTDFISEVLALAPSSLIGVDIGMNSVKVAELFHDKGGHFKLQRFSSVSLPEGSIIEDEIEKPDEIVTALKQAFKAAGIKQKACCLGMSGQNTMSKRLQLATASEEEVEDQVLWEAEQYIPFGVDDSEVTFHVIGENPGGGTDVMLAAGRSDIIESFVDVVKDSGHKVKVVDLAIFSMANVFEHAYQDQMKSGESYLLIDFGAQTTKVLIFKDNSIIFSREISIGGSVVTEEIQRQMGLSYVEAEDLKTVGDENGNLPEEILEIIRSSLENFVSEVKKTINFFMTTSSENVFSKCLITGGNSLLPGLKDSLETNLEVDVDFLYPFHKFDYSNKFSEKELFQIASLGSISMGLAMRKSRE